MSLMSAVRSSLSLKVSLTLGAVMVVLIFGAAFVISAREMKALEALTLEEAKTAATVGAKAYGMALENAIDNSYFTINDVFERRYEEIKGYDWGGKPRFHTKYDFYTDQAMLVFQDAYLESPEFVYAIGSDANGYVPTHNSKYQKPMTGDAAKDLTQNRTKRIFDDEVAQKAAKNTEPHLVQVYTRDTGAKMWDVSAPVEVKGKPWGCFRIGVSMEQIKKYQMQLLMVFLEIFSVFTLISVAAIFFLVRRSMTPLVRLAGLADQISLGEGLDNPIRPATTDEVGMMTKSIDRLRASLKAAMARLGE